MKNSKPERVVVAMSGGVDSSVAALLLVRQGFDVVGVSMRLWSYEAEATHGCCTPEDLYDARRVADRLGIPHYVSNFEAAFEKDVITNFVESYAKGETPNPCVRCNQDVKFHTLLRRARELGATSLATGHYARRVKEGETYRLLRAVDRSRDQSYFLYGIGQAELSMLRFPLGDLHKDEVRRLARDANILVADKEDSQEICFVPDNYSTFVEKRLEKDDVRSGEIVTEDGEVIGRHEGIHRYTVGQRKGLGLQANDPTYVLQVLPTGNVVVGSNQQLRRSAFQVREPRWIAGVPEAGEQFDVQIRSRFQAAPATIDSIDEVGPRVRFSSPQRAITPGQAAVFYKGDEVVGGGWIDSVQ